MIPVVKRHIVDRFGRKISYLRVSLTDRCNLRCAYCYGTGTSSQHSQTQLSNDGFVRLINVFVLLGINKIRFTGGEPLLRPGLDTLIRQTMASDGIALVGITTNGLGLHKKLPELIDAGLNRINISLDTLRRERFREITGCDGFTKVYTGIMSALASKRFPFVKINTVVMRGVNDDEINDFARWAISQRIDIRFIEFMPTRHSGWGEERFVGQDEIRSHIKLPLKPVRQNEISQGPAKSYCVKDMPGRVSFISAVSRSFCKGCNRLRLTASGEIVGCLFGTGNISLAEELRRGTNDEELADLILQMISSSELRRLPATHSVSTVEPYIRKIGG